MSSTISNVLFPPGKLDCEFPWTWRQASKEYFKSLVQFAIGSFLIPLTVLGAVFALAQYWDLKMAFLEESGPLKVVGGAILAGMTLTATVSFWLFRRLLRNRQTGFNKVMRLRNGQFGFSQIMRLASYSLIGGLAFACLLLHGMAAIDPVYPQLMKWIANLLSDSAGNPNMTFVMTLSTVAFVMGFGMQMRSIDRSLRQSGMSLRRFMALNVDKRRGRTWLRTAWNVLWPALLALALWQPLEWAVIQVLGPASQATVEMARKATGGNFLMFAIMAAVGAPIFEELVFRGFLFQVLRGGLKMQLPPAELLTVPTSGKYLGLRRLWATADNWVRSSSHAVSAFVHRVLGGRRAELSAILLSSFMFAVLHMQFQPSALVLLFLLGCIHAELYRRTGSLYCSMVLHALNNGIAVFMLWLGH